MKCNSRQERKIQQEISFSRLPKTGNQNDTHCSNLKILSLPKKYDIDELPEGIFHIIFKIIYHYQWKYPGLVAKYKCTKYKTGFPWRQKYYPVFNI